MSKKYGFVSLMLVCMMTISLAPIATALAEIPELLIQTPGLDQKHENMVPGEVLVKFKAATSAVEMEEIHKRMGGRKMSEIRSLKIQQVKLANGIKVEAAIARYEKMAGVEYAEPNRYRHIMLTPNDTYYSKQWALPKIKAPRAWDITTGATSGSQVIVAVADTGVDYNHPDLTGKIIKGYDFINNDSDPMDDHWHGTHVAGTVASSTNNGKGVAGLSWGAKILAVKVLNSSGSGTDLTVSNGIKYAADNGAEVINLSLGGSGYSSTMANAVSYAQSKGCVVVAAAGNNNTNTAQYPAGYQNVVGVAATDSSDNKASFSNYGSYVDVAAPGVSIISCYKGGYGYASGTSMATPHVAGLAALIASKYTNKDANQLLQSIYSAVDDIGAAGRDDCFGYGRINAEKGVKEGGSVPPPGDTVPPETDTTPPTGSIKINNGASYTRTTSVTLNITATDAGSGLSQMMISNRSEFSGASWLAHATTKSWTLTSGRGTKRVYTI